MTAMPRSPFWRGVEHGQGLGALFVDFRPASVQDDRRIARYGFTARCFAVATLSIVVTGVVILAKSGCVWSALALVGFAVLATVVQLINHAADR
jgi:hypothetical protein